MSPTTPRTAAVRAVVATGLVVAVTSGGFALAATGHLPTLPDQASDTATESVAKSRTTPSESAGETATEVPTASESATATETATETESADATETTEDASPTDGAAPSPNLEGLCKAFQASDKSAHGKALDSAAFTALATAAGSKDGIATYCVTLVGEPQATGKPTSVPTTRPTQAATGKPTTRPTQAATGKPTTAPTTRPTQAATGKPTTAPSTADKGKPTDAGKPAGKGKPATAGNR